MLVVPSLLVASLLATTSLSVRVSSEVRDDSEDTTDTTTPIPNFDEAFFKENCDLSEYEEEGFNQAKYQLSEKEEDDNAKWAEGMQCEDSGHGQPAEVINGFEGSRYECAKACNQASVKHKGKVVCCMHFSDRKTCETRVGWESEIDSSWGRFILNPLNWFRTPKAARLFFTSELGEGHKYEPLDEKKEMDSAKGSQDQVKNLVRQVNHLSINGIMEHLLSFYICMRWIPDAEFVKLAKHELAHTAVDEDTQPLGTSEQVTRDTVLKAALNADITPMRCSSGFKVQDVPGLETLISDFDTETSSMHRLAKTVERIYEHSQWGILNALSEGRRVSNLNRAIHHDEQNPDKDSPYVADMRGRATRDGKMPWPMFLRSSSRFDHHMSQPKNLFMLCFGPRVASFPHKRPAGQHLLADMNMAGCNGFWDITTMSDHMHRIKKLFSPEMCFTAQLKRELRAAFLDTFVKMNEEFETVMAGTYTRRLHELDPLKSLRTLVLQDDLTQYDDPGPFGQTKPFKKYARTGGLLARAHAKWVVCKAKPGIDPEPFGVEENFFRTPQAYDKWLGEVHDETVPECRTLDKKTGCVKCVVAVKDYHGCHLRLNITLDSVFRAASEKKYPFLMSEYRQTETIPDTETDGTREVTRTRTGFCAVRKDSLDLKDYFSVNDTDLVVRVNYSWGSGVVATARVNYTIKERKEKLLEWEASDKKLPDDTVDDETEDVASFRDWGEDFPKHYVFTQSLPGDDSANQPAHKVDYFVTCPCSITNFFPHEHFSTFGSQGMSEYYNGR